MKKLKRQGKRIAVSMLAVAFVLTGSVTPTVLHASEVSTQDIITGDGYSFDSSNGALTVTSNEGSNWQNDGIIARATVKTVDIKKGVTKIDGFTFLSCQNLTSVTIPDSVETIGTNAFAICTNLTSVTIPDSVETIGAGAFSECTNLTNVTMSSRVTSIGESAFSDINNLTLTMTGATPLTLGSRVFNGITTLTIKVPKGTGVAYKGATGWSTHSGKISETNEIPRYSGIQASTPTVKESTHNQVTLDTITVTNETVEYGISSTNDASGCTWQDSPIFTSLNENTTYYFFARVKANATHQADTLTTSVQVKTKEKPVEIKLEEAKAIAVQTINDFVVTNDTEISELLVQLHADMQSVDGVRASWKATPTIVKATETAAGSMQGTIVLTAGDKTVEIEVNKVITKLDHVYTYDIISGKDVSWDKESTKDLVFTIDGDHTKYKGIKIDGKEVLSGNYTITKGSTIVTLKNAYLKTLSIGKHEVTIVFEGKEVKVSFSITGSTDKSTNGGNTGSTTKTPSTNDTTSNHYMILTVLSGTILAVSLYHKKREINNQ